MHPSRSLVLLVLLTGAAFGCRQDMHDQPVLEEYEASDFFADGRGDRMPIEGTVARGSWSADEAFSTGLVGDAFVTELPVAPTQEFLERGRDRYDIFCSPCHDRAGTGRGMIVRRGFKQPTSFHHPRLRAQPVGYFFDVMSRGFGEMSSYAPLVKAEDRWAIAAYVRALQLSQRVVLAELEPSARAAIEASMAEAEDPAATGEAHPETAGGNEHHD